MLYISTIDVDLLDITDTFYLGEVVCAKYNFKWVKWNYVHVVMASIRGLKD